MSGRKITINFTQLTPVLFQWTDDLLIITKLLCFLGNTRVGFSVDVLKINNRIEIRVVCYDNNIHKICMTTRLDQLDLRSWTLKMYWKS